MDAAGPLVNTNVSCPVFNEVRCPLSSGQGVTRFGSGRSHLLWFGPGSGLAEQAAFRFSLSR